MEISGIFKKYTFRNEKNGFSGFFLSDEDTVFCKGFIQTLIFNTPLLLIGEFKTDDQGREYFAFDNYKLSDKKCYYGKEYLINLKIKGLGKKEVDILYNWFNSDVIDVILSCKTSKAFEDRCPDKIKPISRNIYRKIQNVDKIGVLFDLVVKCGGNYNNVRKLMSTYKDSTAALNILKKNPYKAGFLCGLDFNSCDRLAEYFGLTPLNHDRVEGLLLHCIKKSEEAGNSYITIKELQSRCRYEQGKNIFKKIPFQYVLSEAKVNKNVIYNNGHIYKKSTKEMEDNVIRNINRLLRSSSKLEYNPQIIYDLEVTENILLSKSQKKSMNALKSTGIKVVTGGPGSGKSTLMNIIIKYIEKAFPDKKIALCAPTGCAAQNLADKTLRKAETIHKMCNILPYEDDNKMAYYSRRDEDIFIVDESSMLDLKTADVLLSQIKNNALVIFIGDINQLPSIQPGNILQDLIESGIETYYLEGSFRQSAQSPIIKYAECIKNNVLFDENTGGNGFSIVLSENEENTMELCRTFACNKGECQILSPGKKHLLGTRNINNELQQEYIDNDIYDVSIKKQYGMTSFYIGDRVIFTSNNYSAGYYNGNTGTVIDIYPEGMEIQFDNGRTINIKNNNLEDVSLSYALTVHKSQGSEHDNIIIILDSKFLSIMNKNLLYTAITRAKKSVMIITPSIQFINMIINKKLPRRNSGIHKNTILVGGYNED